ncbi:MAG TPA: polysialyltransferase family glycosyltransferase [Candidatus Sulfotelmatobacter sp.]|nr:polysialyltransferase family glycosyltransferase [Candidatus Sulfotelmatobacter sp.]
MKVLLLHPEISPVDGAWAKEHWDLIVDLGYAGSDTYAEWSARFKTRVFSLHEYATDFESYRWAGQLLDLGRGKLLDRTGLDWWEFLAAQHYQDLHVLYLCLRLKSEIAESNLELAATAPHRLVRIIEQVLGQPAQCPLAWNRNALAGIAGKLRSAQNLGLSQVTQIAFDKWDSHYRVRRRWAGSGRAELKQPTVLLPSAYSNVTRSALAYASQLPDCRFLLVTTRRSGNPSRAPVNVRLASLAAYVVPNSVAREESLELDRSWSSLLGTMTRDHKEFAYAAAAGVWDYFPSHLEQGLHLRHAWQELLDAEPITGVLCGDDLNFHTRLPLKLAQLAKLNTVYCSHGALDGGFLFKQPIADCYLVKGEMESEYLKRISNIPPERIVVAAPGPVADASRNQVLDDAVVFFSQPFEVDNGRSDAIYRDIVPRLLAVSERRGRKLVVKLHPFESRRGRQKLLNSILGRDLARNIEIIEGVPPEKVMSRAWCGITVDSSVAIECALRRIPFFLCGWLDFNGMGYLQQYARFGAAQVLGCPRDLDRIPELVAAYKPDPLILDRLWHQADSAELDQVMFGTPQARLDRCAC